MSAPSLLVVASALLGARAPQELADADLAFFEREVRPVLVARCTECHGEGKRRPKGGLRLDTRVGWEAGGDSGPALVPGDVESSRLIRAIRYVDAELEMPPDGKLPEREIAVLEEWVRRGAPDPRGDANAAVEAEPAPAAPHWAFQPMADPAPPLVADERWVRSEIDRFVLARLEAEGLAPAPQIDRRTLLRRASLDLTGLPPTAEELERFASDPAEDAWEREVERLLASPRYGERQAQRWLDVARYADSNGLDENLALGNAWRYRDWVVRALNADLPYDRFVTWQLAGDLLPEPEDRDQLRDRLTATGFLVLGPKMLAEQDKVKLELDVVDEQLDVAGQAFLGLTLGCARCHDHMFDPITQRDYTALAGVFRSTRTMANLDFVSRWSQRELAPAAEVAARAEQVAAIEASKRRIETLAAEGLAALRPRWHADLARYLLAANDVAGKTLLLEAEEFSRGNLAVDRATYGSARSPVIHTSAPGLQHVEYDVTSAAPWRARLEVRYAAEASRPVKVTLDGAVVAEGALAEPTGGWGLAAQRWAAVALLELPAGRSVLRLERETDFPHVDQLLLVPATSMDDQGWLAASPWAGANEDALVPELVRGWVGVLERAARGGDPVLGAWSAYAALAPDELEARAAEVRARVLAAEPAPNALVAKLLDGLPPASLRELAGRYQTLFASVEHAWQARRVAQPDAQRLDDPAQEELRLVLLGGDGPFALPRAAAEALLDEPVRAELAAAREALERELPPPFDLALAVHDRDEPVELPIHVRGSHLNLGPEPVPRGFPTALTALVPEPPLPEDASGRLELARWITDPEHPLTARVAANRAWQALFGEGLVRTPSNFGRRGAPPTHPELLDWLARTLVRDGWSLKGLHRRILLSSAYRMSSVPSSEALARDPWNELLARQNRRRLDAESLRDSILLAGGALDLAAGGSLLGTKDGDYLTNDQSNEAARYESPRRSLYLPVVRNALHDFFASFDRGDPSMPLDRRTPTTTGAQALTLMNAPLVLDAARRMAEAAAAEAPGAGERVDALYRRALGRAPDARERELCLAFVERATAAATVPDAGRGEVVEASVGVDPLHAWRGLAQTLLLSNEFLHAD